MLAPLSAVLASAFCALVLFVALLCPMWLVRVHKFKAQINGPWDEAVPKMSLSLEDPPEAVLAPVPGPDRPRNA